MKQASPKLLDPIKIGNINLKNRVAMAPMTRCRGDPKTGIPSDLMKEYYAQRAQFGLIISECSEISDLSQSFLGSGGIYTEEQTQGWKKVVDAIHEKQGKIFLQIWHCGRSAPKEFIGGQSPLAPSPIPRPGDHPFTQKPYPVPKEMTQEDIKTVIQQFKKGAENAKKAGFDGVQLHGANGYLVDQFLRDGTNKRTDNYGGSIENRCRFMLEVMDVLIEVFGSQRVAIRLSPTGRFSGLYDSNPLELMKYALKELEKRDLAFVEIKRHGALDSTKNVEGKTVDEDGKTLPDVQIPNFFATLRPLYKGVLMGNDGFDIKSAQEALDTKEIDLVSFARYAITNPDLVQRIQNNWDINQDSSYQYYFQGGADGYTTYPFYQQKEA